MVTLLDNKTQESLGNLEFCTVQIIKKNRDEVYKYVCFLLLKLCNLRYCIEFVLVRLAEFLNVCLLNFLIKVFRTQKNIKEKINVIYNHTSTMNF